MSQKIIIEREKIVPLYNETKSINKTAKILGIGWNTCKRILHEYGIETLTNVNQCGEYQILDIFKSIETEEDAYWLGWMYSDGWVRSDKNEIGLGCTDRIIVEKFKTYTGSTNTICEKKENAAVGKTLPDGRTCQHSKPFYSLTFNSKLTKENLRKLGVMPKKSLILQCPTPKQVSDNLLWPFIRGYIDGDGWVRYQEDGVGRYEVGMLGTQHFLEGVTQRLGISHLGKLYKKPNSSTCEFRIYRKKLVGQILEKLYGEAAIYLPRKYNKYLTYIGRSSI